MKTPDELTDLFRGQGLKVTPQRQRIFRILFNSDAHLTAEAVHAAVVADMPTISLRTVYQTLNDLAAMGELVALDLGTGSSRFDPNLGAHHHLVCDRCGKVADVEADFDDIAVPPGKEQGYSITRTQIVFRGRCESCVAAGEPSPSIPVH
ncbi:MAG: transcriptional repressor [Actinomycetota bacterium]|nr:transcriptional repressor [Actinomycetota bacterium]